MTLSYVRRTAVVALVLLVAGPVALARQPASTARNLSGADQQRLLAGHYLRRMGFGPSAQDMEAVLRLGPQGYIDQQLNPSSIDDSAAESRLPPAPRKFYEVDGWIRRWYGRMSFSKRQLQEKMTLIWHQHFATSNAKIGVGTFMHEQEELFRRNCLGSFRQMLIEITTDKAMLLWLDNYYNSGTDTDDAGNTVPPNENYARELLQLFTMGPIRLNLDGTPVLDGAGVPVPNYTEQDVREVARALTGWGFKKYKKPVKFFPYLHDAGNKIILGETLAGRSGKDGAREVDDVVDIIMRHPSTAPFIAKELIQQLATETPTPGYVQRVATVFQQTGGNLKATVRAILTDSEFTSDEVVRTQQKTPIELFVGQLRALSVEGFEGHGLVEATYSTRQLIYYPPSVFSFYRPGNKASLVNEAMVTLRDIQSNVFMAGRYGDAYWDAAKTIRQRDLSTPEQAVDYLADALLAAPLAPETRARIVAYVAETGVTEEKVRGAAWLIVCSPDYQVN
jgi:uncharacterized protein (DUF1800 family)